MRAIQTLSNMEIIYGQFKKRQMTGLRPSLGHTQQRMTQKYAKTIALLSSETGEKTASAIFKDSHL